MPEHTHPARADRSGRYVLLLVALILVASGLAPRVQTAGGEVDVRSFELPTQNGQWLACDLFRPRAAASS